MVFVKLVFLRWWTWLLTQTGIKANVSWFPLTVFNKSSSVALSCLYMLRDSTGLCLVVLCGLSRFPLPSMTIMQHVMCSVCRPEHVSRLTIKDKKHWKFSKNVGWLMIFLTYLDSFVISLKLIIVSLSMKKLPLLWPTIHTSNDKYVTVHNYGWVGMSHNIIFMVSELFSVLPNICTIRPAIFPSLLQIVFLSSNWRILDPLFRHHAKIDALKLIQLPKNEIYRIYSSLHKNHIVTLISKKLW